MPWFNSQSPFSISRAADWDLATPDWKGRMRVVSVGEKCQVKLEDKISGQLSLTHTFLDHRDYICS